MSTSKKTTNKATKSLAPATKTTATKAPAAKAPAAKKSTSPATKSAPASAPVPAVPAAATSPAATAATLAAKVLVKAVTPKPIVTTIAARVDVGFGNALFIRGEGGVLSWNQGLPMECVGADLWQIALEESARAYTFKVLVNDLTWSAGPDFTAVCGSTVTIEPQF